MSKSRSNKAAAPTPEGEENTGTELIPVKGNEKKYTQIKIRGVKDKLDITRVKKIGSATHYFFVHPDTRKEHRVIVLNK